VYYDDSLIEEIRSRNNIVDVIGERVHLTKKGANYMCCCPFHGEKTASFSVSPSRQIFKCFGCGKGGNVFTFISEYENVSWGDAVRTLAQRAGVELPQGNYSAEEKRMNAEREELYEINKQAATYFNHLLKSKNGEYGLAYFRKRGLTDEVITKFGLGYSDKFSDDLYQYIKSKGHSDDILGKTGLFSFDEKYGWHDKFNNRVMFPIMDDRNRVIAFGGRVMGDGEPKYLNSPETRLFEKSRTLYALNYAKTARKSYLLLCEGYMDVIALHTGGFTNAVAALGTAFTALHARIIHRYVSDVVLTFDSDGAGKKAALRAIPILKAEGISARVLNMSPYKDPDEFIKNMGVEAYQKRIDEAKSAFNFEVECMEEKYNLQEPADKTRFYSELADYLAKIKEPIERNNYIEAVDNLYHMGAENLRRLVNERGEKNAVKEVAEETAAIERENMQKAKNRDDGLVQSEKLLLTWAAEDAEVLRSLKFYVDISCFADEPYRSVANLLYQTAEGSKISPGAIIDKFTDSEEQAAVAGIFSYDIRENLSDTERERTFADTVRKILMADLEKRCTDAVNANDMQAFTKLTLDKQNLKKQTISLKK